MDRFQEGDLVVTTKPGKPDPDWVPGSRDAVRWNVSGRVEEVSDAHGLCYRVKHLVSRTAAWYNHDELVAARDVA